MKSLAEMRLIFSKDSANSFMAYAVRRNNDFNCIGYDEERERSLSDDCVMLRFKDEFGITNGQQIQRLNKEERDVIHAVLLRKHASVGQPAMADRNRQKSVRCCGLDEGGVSWIRG